MHNNVHTATEYPFLQKNLYGDEQYNTQRRKNTNEVPLLESKLLPSNSSSIESSKERIQLKYHC